MPSLQKNGRIRLTGAEQIAIIVARTPKPQTGAERDYSLPKYIRAFQKKHGGYFQYKYEAIKFVITNRKKFLARLRMKNNIAEKRRAIRELKDSIRDVANYEALLLYQLRGKGNGE